MSKNNEPKISRSNRIKDHFKRNWDKYALGAAIIGAGGLKYQQRKSKQERLEQDRTKIAEQEQQRKQKLQDKIKKDKEEIERLKPIIRQRERDQEIKKGMPTPDPSQVDPSADRGNKQKYYGKWTDVPD